MKKIKFIILTSILISSMSFAECTTESRTRLNSRIMSVMCVAPKNNFSRGKGIIEFTADYGETETLSAYSYKVCQLAKDASMANMNVSVQIRCIKDEEVVSGIVLKAQ